MTIAGLSSLQADILYTIWLRQVWEKSTPGLTYSEIIAAVRRPDGGGHQQQKDFMAKTIRALADLHFLERIACQPEQRKRRGPPPDAFRIETRQVITWPTTAAMMMTILDDDMVEKQRFFDHLKSMNMVVHNTGRAFESEDAESQLVYSLERKYCYFVKEVPNHLKADDRTVRERPFLKKVAAHAKLRREPSKPLASDSLSANG
jgi:hypothetical protein